MTHTTSSSDTQQSSNQSEEGSSWGDKLWHGMCCVRDHLRGTSESESLREAFEDLIDKTSTDEEASRGEKLLLDNILTLHEKHVDDCMVPRADIVAADIDTSLKELTQIMTQHGHSRLPVYRGKLDEAIGMLHIKDLLRCMVEEKDLSPHDLVRPVIFVAPSMQVAKLLVQMRQTRRHMALVIDEFGGVDGIVTIEDLVEEVVGDIIDEHDRPNVPKIITRPNGSVLIDASILLEEFEERIGRLLHDNERDSIDTLGGYVFHLAGHVPKIGEKVKGPKKLIFEVLECDQNRIKRVRLHGFQQVSEATPEKPA